MDSLLGQVADTVARAHDLESLTRPLLEMLEALTGLDSTYLTRIDTEQGLQHIIFSRNSKRLQIPEGLSVPWDDTLCKRALEEDRPYTDNVAECWGDSDAARALGIRTYLSQPVRETNGRVYGTLCAASDQPVPVAPEVLKVLGLFASLIAFQIERERRMAELERSNAELTQLAQIDALTGIPNRRALLAELARQLARAQREGRPVMVAFIDLDGFKAINDRYGHEVGDRFLRHIAQRLKSGTRAGDFLARYGGDEFVFLASGTTDEELRNRLEALTTGRFEAPGVAFDYGGASVGVVSSNAEDGSLEDLLQRADQVMYEVKRRRREAGQAGRSSA